MSDRACAPDRDTSEEHERERRRFAADIGAWEWQPRSPVSEESPAAGDGGTSDGGYDGYRAFEESVGRFLREREAAPAEKPVRGASYPAYGRTVGGQTKLSYLPGLDGLRALAVIAVLLYHAGLPWIPGGFLGVEVFFVISGYLITALLLAEWRQRGRIDLKAFWFRRARRLLPALYLLLVVTLTFCVVFLPGEAARLRDDMLAALGYVTNWLLIFNQESYFEAAGRPSLLKHLWSLAVEEQFYLLWPPVLVAGLALLPRRYLSFLIVGGAVASSLLMAALYNPAADPSRVYYGADTRAAGLLFGAALAFAWTPEAYRIGRIGLSGRGRLLRQTRRRFRHRLGWVVPRLLDAAGLAALGVLVWFCLWLDEFQPLLYQGGFALVALTTAALILLVVHPRAQVGNGLLGWGPMRWIGLRSYSIYLWHWPVFMVTRPQLDVPLDGLPLLAVRLAATVVLADLSYRFVETPIRRGALGRAWRAFRESEGARRRRLGLQWMGMAGSGLALCLVLGVAVVQTQPTETSSYADVGQKVRLQAGADLKPPPREDSASVSQAPPGGEAAPEVATPAVPAEAEDAPDEEVVEPASDTAPARTVSAVGDSVMLGAAGHLERKVGSLATLDAEVGVQAVDVTAILNQRAAAGELGDIVVVHVGNNGPLRPQQFDEIMGVVGEDRRAVFVTVKVPRLWEQRNNVLLAEGVERYPNAVLVDWYGASVNRPELFWDDGMHLQPRGSRVYVNLLLQYLGASADGT